jgi:hypothetical protein
VGSAVSNGGIFAGSSWSATRLGPTHHILG